MIAKIIELLNQINSFQIIPAYMDKKVPQKPYATYYISQVGSHDFFGATEEQKETENYVEKVEYRTEAKVQFDIYADTEEKALEKAMELRELILFQLRYEWGRVRAGIAKYSNVSTLREIIQDKYEYRAMFQITFEYMRVTKEREVFLAKEIELIANEQKEKIRRKIWQLIENL